LYNIKSQNIQVISDSGSIIFISKLSTNVNLSFEERLRELGLFSLKKT